MDQGPPARKPRHTDQAGTCGELISAQHREMAPGTLRALIRAAGMSVEEFVALV